MQGRYAVLDTTLTKMDATVVDGLSGRQGDSGRVVYFAMKDGNLPHNLDGQDVSLEVKDAAGKVKVINGIYNMISATGGLFSMLIPAEFYQSAGDVEEAYLAVKDSNSTVISSIPITFTVFANGIILSANASQDYIDTIQKSIDDFDKQVSSTNNNLEAVKTAINSLNDAITNYTDLVNTKAVAVKTSTNEFTENNTFDKDITVKGAIHGKADTAGKADGALTADSANTAVTADNAKALAKTANLDNTSKKHEATVDLLDDVMHFIRYGNTVTAKFKNSGSSVTFSQYSTLLPAGGIPAGYRPIDYAEAHLDQAEWLNERKDGAVWLYSNGRIETRNTWAKNTSATDTSIISIFGTYQTADDMPE